MGEWCLPVTQGIPALNAVFVSDVAQRQFCGGDALRTRVMNLQYTDKSRSCGRTTFETRCRHATNCLIGTIQMSNIPHQLKYLQDQGLVRQIEPVFSNPESTKRSLSFIREMCISIKNEYMKFFEIYLKVFPQTVQISLQI